MCKKVGRQMGYAHESAIDIAKVIINIAAAVLRIRQELPGNPHNSRVLPRAAGSSANFRQAAPGLHLAAHNLRFATINQPPEIRLRARGLEWGRRHWP